MEHQIFYNKFCAFLTASLRYLRVKYPKDKLPFRMYEKLVTKKGGSTVYSIIRLDPFKLVTEEYDNILKLLEFDDLFKVFPFDKTNGTKGEIFTVLNTYLFQTKSLYFSQPIFLNIYRKYYKMWQTNRVDVITLCLLSGVSVRHKSIKLSPEVVLRNFSFKEKAAFWGSFDILPHGIQAHDLYRITSVLEIKAIRNLDKFYASNLTDIGNAGDELIPKAITAIRLSSDIFAGIVFTRKYFSPQPRWVMGGSYGTRSDFNCFHGTSNAFLTPIEIYKCKNYFHFLSHENHHTLRLAIRRYNTSFAKRMLDDIVIDLVIALESCLLLGTNKGLTKELQLRSVALLGRKKPHIYNDIKQLYEVRSSLVHTGKPLEQILSEIGISSKPIDYVKDSRNIVRHVIETYLDYVKTLKRPIAEVNKYLDSKIINAVSSISK